MRNVYDVLFSVMYSKTCKLFFQIIFITVFLLGRYLWYTLRVLPLAQVLFLVANFPTLFMQELKTRREKKLM